MAKKQTSIPASAQPAETKLIERALAAAAPRPEADAKSTDKIQYAVRFADAAAKVLEEDLSPRMGGITASPKRVAKSALGAKQLDVNFSTPATGLALGISLKSVHIREKDGRYTHNMKRNEEELRIEASGYHKRQPYAVMVGVLFLPFDSCDDGRSESSSFGSWVKKLRPYSGRSGPRDDVDRFEKLYIALYERDAPSIRFFDVDEAPPRVGRPRNTLSYSEFLEALYHLYLARNHVDFHWDDGTEEPLDQGDDED